MTVRSDGAMAMPDDGTAAVLVVAKSPRPGQVNTRLQPCLGARGCALLQARLLSRAGALAAEVADGAAFLAYSPDDAEPEVTALVPEGVTLLPQREGHLGQRLAAATGEVFARTGGPVAVIGTDVPVLDAARIRAAFRALRDGADVCLGPAQDGGYYLLASARPAPELFELPAEAWGGPTVRERTLAAAAAAELVSTTLPTETDLDTPADAVALLADPRLPAEIADLLAPCASTA